MSAPISGVTKREYPEHRKLESISSQSQAVGTFLDWLSEEKKVTIAVRHQHNEHCYSERGHVCCGYRQDDLMPGNFQTRSLLAEFFEIDERKLEAEKLEMLEELRRK